MTPAKQGFAGARTLALEQDEFQRKYARFAADVSAYMENVRDPAKRLKYTLSVRLFVKFIETEPAFEQVREALAAPGGTPPSEMQKPLLAALKEAYGRLEGSGLYSSKGALSHARDVARVFRWLGRKLPSLYPHVKRILWQDFENGDTRKNRSATILVRPMKMEEITAAFGPMLSADVDDYQAKNGARATLGFRKVLAWLCQSYREEGAAVIRAYQSGGNASCDPAAVKSVIDEWAKATAISEAYSPKTFSNEKRYAAVLFEHLGALEGRNYPHFSKTYVKSKYAAVESKSLADIDFPETRNLSGAARLRHSLKIVMDEAFAVLRQDRRIFDLLAPARENAIPDGLPAETRTSLRFVATVMQAEMHSLRETGKSQFSTQGVRTDVEGVDRALEELACPGLWRQIGLPASLLGAGPLGLQAIRSLLCRGIGAPRSANLAAKLIFACDKGWNRQPIENVPPAVYVFRVGDEFGVASASFLSVFKNRAGHDVLALLEHGNRNSTGRREAILAAWEQAEDAAKWPEMDERSLLTATDPTYEAIELLRPLVEPLGAYTQNPDAKNRFFKFLVWSDGVSINDRDVRASFRGGILGRKGVTFPAARKTVLQLKVRDVGSIGALRPDAGHAGLQVLLPSYLNSPSTLKELWQATRFFQNAVQALTIAGVGCKLEMRMSPEDQDWFFRLAHASGVASAVGFGVSIPIGGPVPFDFEPSTDEIRELVSLHVAVILERRTMPPWLRSMIAIPLLGFVIAMKRMLRQVGLGSLLNRVSRQFLIDLSAGVTVTPKLRLQGHLAP